MKTGYVFLKKGLLVLFLLLSTTFIYSQQFLVNSEWNSSILSSDTSIYFYRKATVKTDAARNIYTLGSDLSNTGHNWLLMKQNSSGDTLFITQFNGDGDGEDYAADMWVDDATENVYIVGRSTQNGSDSLDACIAAFDSTGAELWHTYLGGTNSYNDAYLSIATDGSTYLYAGGAIGTASNGYDYLLTGFDFSGAEQFTNTYDYTGYNDVAIKVVYDGGDIFLAGASQPTDTTWDYYIQDYKYNGVYSGDYRNYAGTGDTHRPTDAIFYNNYYYVTGGVSTGGSNYDIKTLVLDTALNVVWEQTYDGMGLPDMSRSIKVDSNGNVYITGSTTMSNWTTNMVTIKYDQYGNEKWVRSYDWSNLSQNDGGYDLELNNDNVYVTGYVNNSSNYNTICYDTAGTSRWQKMSVFGYSYPTDMAIDLDGNVIIAAPLSYLWYTEKFSILELQDTAVFQDSSFVDSVYIYSLFQKDELVVQFNPDMINTSTIDNPGLIFGKPSAFLTPTAVSTLEDKLGLVLDRDVTLIKVFKRLKTTDTLSIARDSLEYYPDKIWSYLRFKFSPSLDIFDIQDSLETLDSIVFNVEINPFAEAQINDPYFSLQSALFDSNSDTTINVEGAWLVETGKEHIRVGIIDHPVCWFHEDFIDAGLNLSAVKGGWDYWNNQDLFNISFPATFNSATFHMNHGTAMAGLVGALRNNGVGVAGVAGGDIQGAVPTPGVSLYSLRIFRSMPDNIHWRNTALSTDIADAIVEGSSYINGGFENGGYGFGCHILNNSWAIYDGMYLGDADIDNDTATNVAATDIKIIRNAIYQAWRNGTVIPCARGNYGVSTKTYPSCYEDPMTISVGGSGINGKYLSLEGPYNGFYPTETFQCSYKNLDIIAPATIAMNQTTVIDASPDGFGCSTYNYDCTNGTSTSSALVSGVSGLMLSQQNGVPVIGHQNLCNEDVERILENYCNDVDDIPGDLSNLYGPKPDNYNGYGRVNAATTMSVLDYPSWQIYHSGPFLSSTATQVASNMSLIVPQQIGVVIPNLYVADKYAVVQHYTDVFTSSTTLNDYWPRLHGTNGFGHANPAVDFPYAEMDVSWNSGTGTATVTMTSYVYHITAYSLGSLNLWIPCDTGHVKTPYSLHIYDPNNTDVQTVADNNKINLYPNPTNNTSTLYINASESGYTALNIFDISGKVVFSGAYSVEKGENFIMIDSFNLTGGIYFLNFELGGKWYNLKLIKTNNE